MVIAPWLAALTWILISGSVIAQSTLPPEKLVIDFGVDYFGGVLPGPRPWEAPASKLIDRVKEFWSASADLESAKGHLVAAITLDEHGTVSDISIVEPSPIAALNTAARESLAHLNPTPLLPEELPLSARRLSVAIFWNEASQPGPIPEPPDWPPAGALRPGNGVTLPQLVHEKNASYTRLAMAAKIQGRILT
jgi:TonB family protein